MSGATCCTPRHRAAAFCTPKKKKAHPDEGEGQPPWKKPKTTPVKCRLRRCSVNIAPDYVSMCNKRAAVLLLLPSGKPADAYCMGCWQTEEIRRAFGHWRHQVL